MAADMGLNQSPFILRGFRTNTPGGWLQITTEHRPTSSTNSTLEGELDWYQNPTKVTLAPWGQLPQKSCPL